MKTFTKSKNVSFFIAAVVLISLISCKKNDGEGPDNIGTQTVKDVDGNEYGVVKVGDQYWLSKNLRVTKYRDGSGILSNLYSDYEWASAGPAACIYPANLVPGAGSLGDVAEKYGILYNWYAVNNSNGLCPDGFRVPDDEDWDKLVTYLGGEEIAGGKLKTLTGWESPNTGAADDFHFKAVPSGLRSSLGEYMDVGYWTGWWSTDVLDADFASFREISYDDAGLYQSYKKKRAGLPVRCIMGSK